MEVAKDTTKCESVYFYLYRNSQKGGASLDSLGIKEVVELFSLRKCRGRSKQRPEL